MDVRTKAQQLAARLAFEAELTPADQARLTLRLELDLKTSRIWWNSVGAGWTADAEDADWYVEDMYRMRLRLPPVPPPRHRMPPEVEALIEHLDDSEAH